MASNRLKLNPSKTEIIWLGSAGQLQRCPMTPLFIAGAWITPSSRVRNLGVIIDGALTMGAHVDKLVGICFFHLRQLRIVRRTLDVDAAHALVRALIHSRLDYCNSVLAGLPAYMFKRLQSVLNAAARLVLQLPGRQSVIIPMAEKLHWLGFPHRVTYKLCALIYKGLHGLAPDYLSRRCVRVRDVPGRAHLRSASAGQLMVPITNRKDDWRQRVLTLWPCGMEQSASASAERRLHPIIRLFQKTLEDGPVQTDHPKIIIQ